MRGLACNGNILWVNYYIEIHLVYNLKAPYLKNKGLLKGLYKLSLHIL